MKDFGQNYNDVLSIPFYEAQLILEHAKDQMKEQNEGQQAQQAQMEKSMKQPKMPDVKIPEVKMPNIPGF